MASRHYLTGLVLLVILLKDAGLSSGATSDPPMSASMGPSESNPSPTMPWMSTAPGMSMSMSPSMSPSPNPNPNPSPSPTPSMNNETSKISCRQFTCNETKCYSMFMNQTAMPCNSSYSYCLLQRIDYMCYTVSCSAACPATCVNATQTGCAMDCCNTTDCLNGTMFSMLPTEAPTTMKSTTTAVTKPAKNGKKCHSLKCTGEWCFEKEDQQKKIMECLVGQDYCRLNKVVKGSVMTWTAGCSKDCRKETVCTSTSVDCTRECCKANKTASCLELSSSPAPGPALTLLASALLAWLIGSQLHSL